MTNRVKKFYIANNEYSNNGEMGCTLAGLGHRDYKYQGVIRHEKAFNNMLSDTVGSSWGSGNMNFYGIDYTIIEECYVEATGSCIAEFDGVGMFCNIIRNNYVCNSKANPWLDAVGNMLWSNSQATPPSGGISMLYGLGNIVCGNILSDNSTGVSLSRCGNTRVDSNVLHHNDIGVMLNRDGGTNFVACNEIHNGQIGLAQEVEAVRVTTGTYTISDDPLSSVNSGTDNVKIITAATNSPNSNGVRTNSHVEEINGPGLAVTAYGTDYALTSKMLIITPFSKSTFGPGELQFFLHKNLVTNTKAKGSVKLNNVTANRHPNGKLDSLATWPAGFTDKSNYGNGLTDDI
jgi:parallel beta-helix repeat protein